MVLAGVERGTRNKGVKFYQGKAVVGLPTSMPWQCRKGVQLPFSAYHLVHISFSQLYLYQIYLPKKEKINLGADEIILKRKKKKKKQFKINKG